MNLSRKLLAGAIFALLPLGGALACTSTAWLGTAGPNPTIAEDPDSNAATNNSPDTGAVRRYSGQCGLQAAATGQSWVTDNTPGGAGGGESIYRARVYLFTGQSGAQVFSATTADNGGGTPVVGITFNGSAFVFTVNGATVPDVTGITANSWYAVEFLYQASGAFTATVRGGGASNQTVVNSTVNAGALTVGSARVGHINAGSGTGNVLIDEFDSSRSAATAIGRLCPADATGNRILNVADIAAITAERNGSLAPGQPDCTENGVLNVSDIACVISFRSATPPNNDCVFN